MYFWEQNSLPCQFMNLKKNSGFVKISVLDVISQPITDIEFEVYKFT